jgi:hypothetical protein
MKSILLLPFFSLFSLKSKNSFSYIKEQPLPVLVYLTFKNDTIAGFDETAIKKILKQKKVDVINLDEARVLLQRQMEYLAEPYRRTNKVLPKNFDELMSKEPPICKDMRMHFYVTNDFLDSIQYKIINWGGDLKSYKKTYFNCDSLEYKHFFETSVDSLIAKRYLFASYIE